VSKVHDLLGEGAQDPLRSVMPAALFIVTRQRNAWHGTESRQYKGPTSLTTTLSAAKKVGEGWRRQGSQFTIQEIPGLLIASHHSRYALVEFHSSNSFGTWRGDPVEYLRPGIPLRSVLDAFLDFTGYYSKWTAPRPSPDSLVSRRLQEGEIPLLLEPGANLRAWSSEFIGADYLIYWREQKGRHKPDGTLKIADTFLELSRPPKPQEL